MKRSLNMGINDYPGTGSDLAGCLNDANDLRAVLEGRGYKTTSLLDGEATKSNMIESITKIVVDTGRDDIAVITYSGHGTWVPDSEGDEADGRDEALCPHDVFDGQTLTDDELHEIFSKRRWGARIIFFSDSCHSGTVSRAGNIMPGAEDDPWKFPKIRYLAPEVYIKGDDARLRQARKVEKSLLYSKTRAATLLLSGCKDTEYSYDAWFNGRANGAFTYVALKSLKTLPSSAVYRDWYRKIREVLPHNSYPQTPQMSGTWEQRARWKVLQP